MRRTIGPILLLAACTGTLAGSETSARADRPKGEAITPRITGASLGPGQWYWPESQTFKLNVDGTPGSCGLRSVWTRAEDNWQNIVNLGNVTLPGWVNTTYTTPPPLPGLPPGHYTVTVEGAEQASSTAKWAGCQGSFKFEVLVDENIIGGTFPKIVKIEWEGATDANPAAGLYKVGGPDKILDVTVANYLSGGKWVKPTPQNQGAVCALSITTSEIGGSGGWPDPYPLVLANASGGTSVYRGQIVTPGPWGAVWHANVTKIIQQYIPIAPGHKYGVSIKAIPFNASAGGPPCMGSASATLIAN
jgi:hypothetical protein